MRTDHTAPDMDPQTRALTAVRNAWIRYQDACAGQKFDMIIYTAILERTVCEAIQAASRDVCASEN